MTIIALGLTIGGLIKKKRKLWIGSLSAFVLLTMFSVFTITTYISKSIDYMASDEFQEETKKAASNWGKNIGNTVTGAAEGLESTLDEDIIAKFAKKSGVILGSSVEAITSGVGETLGKQTVYADKKIEKDGIVIGRTELLLDSVKYSYGVFLEFKKDYKGKLRLTAFDTEGKKIDNAEVEIDQKSGQDKVFVFEFDYLNPAQSEYSILSSVKE